MACSKTAFIEFKDCESSYLFEVDLTPSTSYFYEITDKFGNVYQKAFTTDEDGYFSISPNDFPPYLLTNAGGNFTLIIKESLTDCTVVDFNYCEDTFDTIVFSFIKNIDNGNAQVVDKCQKVYDCLGISESGSDNKFLNEQGDFISISRFTCSDLNTCSTSNLQEGSRLYFTDNRAISALTGQNISLFTNNVGYLTSSSLTPYLTISSASSTYYPITNPNNYLSSISSLDVTTALGYTPYNSTNPSGFITSSSLTPYLLSSTAASTYESIITPGTTSQWRRGDNTWQTIDKSTIGLGNVDNTSDANKPISTATQNALDLKANKSEVATVLFKSITPTIITGKTVETSIYSIPLPTDGGNYIIRLFSQAQITTFAGSAISHKVRLGSYASPIDGASGANAIGNQSFLNHNGASTTNNIGLIRTFVLFGGASGSILGVHTNANISYDESTVFHFDTLASKDFTTQQYLYITFNANNATASILHNFIYATAIKI